LVRTADKMIEGMKWLYSSGCRLWVHT